MSAVPLRNCGPISQVWLQAVGIDSREALRQAGVIATVCTIRAAGYPANFNLVLALQGALLDCDWRALPDAVRSDLRLQWALARRKR